MIRILLSLLVLTAAVSACTRAQGPSADQIRAQVNQLGPSALNEPLLLADLEELDRAATLIVMDRKADAITWRTGDNSSLSFDEGVLVATRGLGFDLMVADVSGTKAALQGRGGSYEIFRNTLDGEDRIQVHTFVCQVTGRASETLSTLQGPRSVIRVTESCRSPIEMIENIYWRAADGMILKSRQWISQGAGYVTTERLAR